MGGKTDLLSRRRFDRLIEADYFRVSLRPKGRVKLPLLDAEDLRIDTVDGLDKDAVRSVSNHWDERANVHAVVGNTEEDDSVYCLHKFFVVLVLRPRQCYEGLRSVSANV
jgi:hypothetical protein